MCRTLCLMVLLAGCSARGLGHGDGGAPAGWTACSGPGQCTLAGSGCCQQCPAADLTGQTAINSSYLAAYRQEECPTPTNCPAGVCALQTRYATAVCRDNLCTGIDVRTDELSACGSDSDCSLRNGLDCCESCVAGPDSIGFVAVNNRADLRAALCAPGTQCPQCATPVPANLIARCVDAHCTVQLK